MAWTDVFSGYDQAIFYSMDIFFDYDAVDYEVIVPPDFDVLNGPTPDNFIVGFPVGPITGEMTYDQFFYSTDSPASPFVAFVGGCDPTATNCSVTAQTGQTTHKTMLAHVPAPAPLFLLLAGLAGMAVRQRLFDTLVIRG